MSKVAVIGAGFVGSTAAFAIAQAGVADEVVLIDILDKPAQGKALDILEAMPIYGHATRVRGGSDYALIDGAGIVVVTAGVPRKPEETRDDPLPINARIVKQVIAEITARAPDAIIIMVTNPVDAMTLLALRESGFPKERVMGMGGTLDSARFAAFIAEATQAAVTDVDAMVIGNHGDAMVPLTERATVRGERLAPLLDKERIAAIVERTRHAGAEIYSLLGSGNAYVAPAAAILRMVRTIIMDGDEVMPVSAYLEGEYNESGICMGVPCRIGKGGITSIIAMELSRNELRALALSAERVRELSALLPQG